MARPTGKTFTQQPVGNWPRHRALTIEVRGFANYPDSGSGEPLRGNVEVHALQGEGDDAFRRMAHKEFDKALDALLPRLATRPEWVVHRMDRGPKLYTWAHKVERRTPRKLLVACGAFDKAGGDPFKDAIFGGPQLVINWGECKACAAGVRWDSAEGEAAFQGMLRDG